MTKFILLLIVATFVETAVAENLVMDDASIQYTYTYQKLGVQNFCDFATTMAKAPMVIKLTAAFITDDSKPKDKDVTVAYIVEAFVARVGKNSKLEPVPVKVVAARIISDMFNSDLHATKNTDKGLGASYNIVSEGSLSLFTGVITLGKYNLAVELENHATVIVNVHPTPKIFDASQNWSKCSIAIMEHRTPQ